MKMQKQLCMQRNELALPKTVFKLVFKPRKAEEPLEGIRLQEKEGKNMKII